MSAAEMKDKEQRKQEFRSRPMFKSFKPFGITVCKRCHQIILHNRQMDEEKAYFSLTKQIISNISFNHEPDSVTVDIPNINPDSDFLRVKVELVKEPESGSDAMEETEYLDIILNRLICRNCMKSDGQYYEGILQIRGSDKERITRIGEDVIERVHSSEPKVFINKITEDRHGADFYLTSKKYLHQLSKDLQNNYGGTLKESHKIFSRSRQSSKEIYRTTICLRIPSVEPGDIILESERPALIRGISADHLTILYLSDSKKRIIRMKEEPQVLAKLRDLPKATILRTKPALEVMDPNTYQPREVANSIIQEKDSVFRLFIHEGLCYLIGELP